MGLNACRFSCSNPTLPPIPQARAGMFLNSMLRSRPSAIMADNLAFGLCAQLVEQRLRFLEVDGIEAFGEPIKYRGEYRPCLITLVLLGKQAREADSCA